MKTCMLKAAEVVYPDIDKQRLRTVEIALTVIKTCLTVHEMFCRIIVH